MSDLTYLSEVLWNLSIKDSPNENTKTPHKVNDFLNYCPFCLFPKLCMLWCYHHSQAYSSFSENAILFLQACAFIQVFFFINSQILLGSINPSFSIPPKKLFLGLSIWFKCVCFFYILIARHVMSITALSTWTGLPHLLIYSPVYTPGLIPIDCKLQECRNLVLIGLWALAHPICNCRRKAGKEGEKKGWRKDRLKQSFGLKSQDSLIQQIFYWEPTMSQTQLW